MFYNIWEIIMNFISNTTDQTTQKHDTITWPTDYVSCISRGFVCKVCSVYMTGSVVYTVQGNGVI